MYTTPAHTDSQTLLEETTARIAPVNHALRTQCQERLDNLTKPQGSLGYLEELAIRYCLAADTPQPLLGNKSIFTFAADHGVVSEGVSPSEQCVTVEMVHNMLNGKAAINILATAAGANLRLVDIGVNYDFSSLPPQMRECLYDHKVNYGTQNIARGPAMSYSDTLAAIATGITLAQEEAFSGCTLMGTGEMGVGNTTVSAALMCAMMTYFFQNPDLCKEADITPTQVRPAEIAGTGAGLPPNRLDHKIRTIKMALKANRKQLNSPLTILQSLGGFELAAICGLILGGASFNVCMVIDGYISTAAALVAIALCPQVKDYCFFSHQSAEGCHGKILSALGVRPILHLDMRLGEGTGAALAMQSIEAAIKLYTEMVTFEEANVTRIKDAPC